MSADNGSDRTLVLKAGGCPDDTILLLGKPPHPSFREGGRALAGNEAQKSEDGKLQPLKPISSPYLKILPHRFTLESVQAELLLSLQAAIKKTESQT